MQDGREDYHENSDTKTTETKDQYLGEDRIPLAHKKRILTILFGRLINMHRYIICNAQCIISYKCNICMC